MIGAASQVYSRMQLPTVEGAAMGASVSTHVPCLLTELVTVVVSYLPTCSQCKTLCDHVDEDVIKCDENSIRVHVGSNWCRPARLSPAPWCLSCIQDLEIDRLLLRMTNSDSTTQLVWYSGWEASSSKSGATALILFRQLDAIGQHQRRLIGSTAQGNPTVCFQVRINTLFAAEFADNFQLTDPKAQTERQFEKVYGVHSEPPTQLRVSIYWNRDGIPWLLL
jgi:hypothetical protein